MKQSLSDVKNQKHLLLLFVFLILGIGIKSLGLLINITPSMPLGVYIRATDPISRGDIIAFCLSEPYQSIGIKQGYFVSFPYRETYQK